MIIPIRTDRRLEHVPWVNYGLIAVNIIAFILTRNHMQTPAVGRMLLDPRFPALDQFITYQFLHADWWHLLGNMLFLYIFGNSVEDRLGKVGYIAFYLAGGVMAGYGHALLSAAPVLGASGAVAAVSGAYLALFPKSNITLFYFFYFIGFFEVPSMWLIGFYIVTNIFYEITGSSGVAYMAHLAGYAFGFVMGMGLLGVRLLPREPYDMLSMIEQWRRRKKFQALTKQGYQPWMANKPGEPPKAHEQPTLTPREQALHDKRAAILAALEAHDLAGASRRYLELLALDDQAVLSEQYQLDIANQLMQDGHYNAAANAYELFLRKFPDHPHKEQVQLILGLICARYLDRADRAKALLTDAIPKLHDQDQRDLAEQILAQVG